jgi:hypothetical protein
MTLKKTDHVNRTLLGPDQTASRSAMASFERAVALQNATQTQTLRLALEPTEAIRQLLKALDLTTATSEALKKYQDGVNSQLRHARAASHSITTKFALQLESMMAATHSTAKFMEGVKAQRAALDAMRVTSPTVAAHFGDLARQHTFITILKQVDRWDRPYSESIKSFAHYKEPPSLAAFRSLSESLARVTRQANLEGSEGFLADDAVLHERVASALHAITVEAEAQPSLQAAVDQIIAAIEATKEPVLQKFLWFVLLPLLLLLVGACITPVTDFYIKQHLESASKQGAIKIVKEAAREALGDVSLLRDYRFVAAQRLDVRSAPGARAPALGQLRFGQVVQILQRNGDFTLVSWRNAETRAELQGWVFSRYLKRFD